MRRSNGFGIALLTLALGTRMLAAGFGTNNLVIYRIGGNDSGGTSGVLTNQGNIVWLDEYTTNGTFVQSHMMPTNYFGANHPLIGSGTAFGSGLITRSADGRFILVCGYGATLGQFTNFGLQSATSIEAPRIIGLVDGNGNIDTTTSQTNFFAGEEMRSAASTDGTNLWFAGSGDNAGGVRYTTRGDPLATRLSTFVTNIRQLNIYSNQLYLSSGSGSTRVALLTNDVPNTIPTTPTNVFINNLAGVPSSIPSPWSFALFKLNAGGPDAVDTLYVADATTNRVLKYTLIGSTNWVSTGSATAFGALGLTGRTRIVGTTTNVDLFITGGGGTLSGFDNLYALTDTSGYNGILSGDANGNVLVTSAENTRFLGIAFAPVGGETFPDGPGRISVGPLLGLFSGGLTGCSVAQTQTYSIANFGTTTVSWQATTDVNWVTITPASGTLASSNSTTVTAYINANATSLPTGTNTATITFTNTTSALGTTTRAVRLILNDQTITPTTIFTISGQPGGPFTPSNRVYTVNNGATPITLAVSKSASWLDLSATSISLGACASVTVTVSVNATANSLAAGGYSDTISFSNATAGALIDTRSVGLQVGTLYFCDDFSTFASGNLVPQQGWTQLGTQGTNPLQVSTNGAVVVPSGTGVDGQDAWKNFPQNWNTTVFAGILVSINKGEAAATNQSPSFFAAMYNLTNAGGFANYRLSAQDADGQGTNAFKFSGRTTGQAGAPWTNGATALSYDTQYRVIIQTDPIGSNMTVYVNPSSSTFGVDTPYLVAKPTGTIGLATNVGAFVISQFDTTAKQIGCKIYRVCINTDWATVFNGLGGGPPADPFATWQFTYFGSTNSAASQPGADPDGDGMINTNEFLAGFNPTNSAAYLRIISVVSTGSDVRVTYLGANGDSSGSPGPKTNVLEFTAGAGGGRYSNNFTSTGQTNILGGGTGIGVVTNMVDPGGATNTPARYYRVRVLAP